MQLAFADIHEYAMGAIYSVDIHVGWLAVVLIVAVLGAGLLVFAAWVNRRWRK